jgi:nitrate reductase delta subunit
MNRATYEAIATALSYPTEGYSAAVRILPELVPSDCAAHAGEFVAAVVTRALETQQELFTQTFDLNPVCSLELGWHLFGENYERGLLLVRMREELRAAGISEDGELPDHLTYALRLLPLMDQDRAVDFAGAIVMPALVKMVQAIRGKNNPYEQLLHSLATVMRLDFPEVLLPESKVELPVLPQEVTL